MFPENTFLYIFKNNSKLFWILYSIAIELNEKDKLRFLNKMVINVWT